MGVEYTLGTGPEHPEDAQPTGAWAWQGDTGALG